MAAEKPKPKRRSNLSDNILLDLEEDEAREDRLLSETERPKPSHDPEPEPEPEPAA